MAATAAVGFCYIRDRIYIAIIRWIIASAGAHTGRNYNPRSGCMRSLLPMPHKKFRNQMISELFGLYGVEIVKRRFSLKEPKTGFDALNFRLVRLIPIVLNRSGINKSSSQQWDFA